MWRTMLIAEMPAVVLVDLLMIHLMGVQALKTLILSTPVPSIPWVLEEVMIPSWPDMGMLAFIGVCVFIHFAKVLF